MAVIHRFRSIMPVSANAIPFLLNMEKTEILQIADISAFIDHLPRLAGHNPDYDLTRRELIQKGLIGQRIYETVFPSGPVAVVPGLYPRAAAEAAENLPVSSETEAESSSSAEEASPEETPAEISADPDCLLVQISGESIGYIRKNDYPHMKELLDGSRIVSMSVELHGGPYRMLFEDETLEDGSAGYYALLTVQIREDEPERNASRETGTMHYISTSYDTVLLEKRGRRGNGALVLALLLGAFYLGFSIPYWIMIRKGLISAAPFLGGDLPDNLLNPHIALAAGAVILTFIALLMKNSIVPMLAALAFTASAWTLPGYALFTAPSAVLCMAAALRKNSKPLLTFIKVLVLFAVLGGIGWFLKDTALYFWNNKAFMIRPTGHEETVPADDFDLSDEDDLNGDVYDSVNFMGDDSGDEGYGDGAFEEEDYDEEDDDFMGNMNMIADQGF